MSGKFQLKKDNSMLTPAFRVTFPYVLIPNDEGKFGCGMIFEKDVDFSVLEQVVEATILAKWGKNAPKNLMLPVLDGDASDRPEYAGKFYINAKAGKYRPGLVDQNLVEITDAEEFYPGCYARATITCYAWTFKGKAGVSVGVRNIQKLDDGEPLLSRVRADNDFEAVDAGEDL